MTSRRSHPVIYRSYTRLPDAAAARGVRMFRGHCGLGALPARVACSRPGAPRSSATCSRRTMTRLSCRIPRGTRRCGLRYGQFAASAPTRWPPQHLRRVAAGRGAPKPLSLGCDRACNATASRWKMLWDTPRLVLYTVAGLREGATDGLSPHAAPLAPEPVQIGCEYERGLRICGTSGRCLLCDMKPRSTRERSFQGVGRVFSLFRAWRNS